MSVDNGVAISSSLTALLDVINLGMDQLWYTAIIDATDRTPCRSLTHDLRSDHDRLFHPGNQDRAASRIRPGDVQGGVHRPARRTATDRLVLLRRFRGRGPAHRAAAWWWTAGHDLTGGLLARAGHRGAAGRADGRGCHREGARARRRWRPPGGHRHRPRWQRPRAA